MARRVDPSFDLEDELWAQGCETIVGIDEVGKGAWAGPLVIGAVVVPRGDLIAGVRDSKAMTPRARDDAYDRIIEWCLDWSIGEASATECDELGMAAAQKLACRRAITALSVMPDVAISDGTWDFVSPLVPRVEMRVKADRDCGSVAAASVVAKVSRDRQMVAWSQSYPYWSFEGNKGYPCPAHIRALHGHGPSAIHRRSWAFMDNHVHWSGSRRVVRGQMPTLF
ncbi:MAG: ribonuclease HII [Ilumatobacter coccineus]|uniref:Ribonuclease n=1 Tax=Ilumatobacter coccineus TaxID=467094 RepID=A0A2G6KB77_9ACTN|nr:MAG: ribonuclease HII [Ilumatobacter coccineus]